jgi:hypothetical protein
MNYQQFIDGAELYHQENKLTESKGKAYMNYLRSYCMPCYKHITGTELDPTYSSGRFPGFLLFIQHHISSFC